jgi:hypothetical protein
LDRYDEYFARDQPVIASVDCSRCSFYSFIPTGVVLLTRPRSTGALYDAGLDVRDTPLWAENDVVGRRMVVDAPVVVSSDLTTTGEELLDVLDELDGWARD